MHEHAHDNASSEKRKRFDNFMVCLYISRELGLTGVCDVVEFHKSDDGAIINGYDGLFKIVL